MTSLLDPNSNNDKVYSKVYIEERKSLIDAKREGARLFVKAILTLAVGAFGLSLTFIKEIVPCVKSGTIFMLAGAWIGFCISILSTLISFLTSQSACRKQIEILDANHIDNDGKQDKKTDPKNVSAIWTRRLNKLSMITFIIGVIFLALFSFVNLSSYKEVVM